MDDRTRAATYEDVLRIVELLEAERWVRALGKLPDGAAHELDGDTTLHEEPYEIRINDEFTVDVMRADAEQIRKILGTT